jgi:hypothetical protein
MTTPFRYLEESKAVQQGSFGGLKSLGDLLQAELYEHISQVSTAARP